MTHLSELFVIPGGCAAPEKGTKKTIVLRLKKKKTFSFSKSSTNSRLHSCQRKKNNCYLLFTSVHFRISDLQNLQNISYFHLSKGVKNWSNFYRNFLKKVFLLSNVSAFATSCSVPCRSTQACSTRSSGPASPTACPWMRSSSPS